MYKGYIKTVTGPIKLGALGYCQCHEHVYIRGKIDDTEKSVSELKLYKEAGGDSLVDAQPQGAGSDLAVLKKMSLESGVNIIASTGFHKPVYYEADSAVFTESITSLAGMFVSEIEAGAGIIKTALCGNIEGIYKKLHEASAAASKETGAPVICHIDTGTYLLPLIAFYAKRDIPSSRLILCHADRFVKDLKQHEAAAETGAYLEYDTIARPKYHSDKEEIDIILYMRDKGYIKNILLGLDTTKERLLSYGGDVGLTYLRRTFIPGLLNAGADRTEINLMTIENCKTALCFK